MVAGLRRWADDPGFSDGCAADENMIEAGRGKTFVRREGDACARRDVAPAPDKSVVDQTTERGLSGELFVVERGVAIAAQGPGDATEFSVGLLHRRHMGTQLAHRFLANRDVLLDLAQIALEMHRIEKQEPVRRELIGRESETARRHQRAIWFPLFGPGTEGLEPTGNGDFLGL